METYLLVLTTPFQPNDSFKKLRSSQQKLRISAASIGITLFFLLIINYFHFRFSNVGLIISFALGFIFKILILSVITSILSSQLLKQSLKLLNSISIVSVSTLPLIISPSLEVIFGQQSIFFGLISSIIFGMLIALGLGQFYAQPLKKTLIIAFGILLIERFLAISFMGLGDL